MTRILICLFLLISTYNSLAQSDAELLADIEAYQNGENEKFGNPETTILEAKDLKEFEALNFYPIDLNYRVEAKFVRTPNEKPFFMFTTTDRLPKYVKYGEAHFMLNGKALQLNLYQYVGRFKTKEYENLLFLPFTDLTSGDGSYGGGRYIDTQIPEGDTIVIDFNKSYNPYCVYNKEYSCPIPPKENDLLVRVEAGVKDFKNY